jgi:hypothetical protein
MSKIYRTPGDWFILIAYWIGALGVVGIIGTILVRSVNK